VCVEVQTPTESSPRGPQLASGPNKQAAPSGPLTSAASTTACSIRCQSIHFVPQVLIQIIQPCQGWTIDPPWGHMGTTGVTDYQWLLLPCLHTQAKPLAAPARPVQCSTAQKLDWAVRNIKCIAKDSTRWTRLLWVQCSTVDRINASIK